MQQRIFFFLLGTLVCFSLSAQTYQGNGEIQWNFLKGGSMAHSLSTDQLVVTYKADQDLLQLL
ncbi:MAG: hypothetical protein AAF804_16175, partial [Bacteroidota bacterium]